MSQVKLVKFKIKKGGKKNWLNWVEKLKKRKEEVIKTLENEGIISESCFISEDGEFVFYFMEAEDFKKVNEAFSKSTKPIDAEHKKSLDDSLRFVSVLENLFHFESRK
jgi:L-rhamnose mutarotase